ncbi:hypothetical protein [Flavobacterium sp.]|uniref:hypothetical protein n=1 Tax=Flavobacterium sp. TaxID=239 RepID=UPI00260AF28E|nr:hypothetical protein [Flavobacterium sp.]
MINISKIVDLVNGASDVPIPVTSPDSSGYPLAPLFGGKDYLTKVSFIFVFGLFASLGCSE